MNPAGLLLADPSPCLRRQVLSQLMARRQSDPEVVELAGLADRDPHAVDLLRLQRDDGSWSAELAGTSGSPGAVRATWLALHRLGHLGFDASHPTVHRGAEWLFALQGADGSWPLHRDDAEGEETEGYQMVPLQTALPLMALALCGYACDPRAERGYEWLLRQRLPDGAWPTGLANGNYGRVAGYRRLAHSRWGCRSNTTGALACLALHPVRRRQAEARRGLDLLLGRDSCERHTLGYEVARRVGAEPARGFLTYYARYDAAQVLDLSWRVGASAEDERVARMVSFVAALRGGQGMWEHPSRSEVTRWLTFDLLRSLAALDRETDWLSFEPPTPFSAYPPRRRRF